MRRFAFFTLLFVVVSAVAGPRDDKQNRDKEKEDQDVVGETLKLYADSLDKLVQAYHESEEKPILSAVSPYFFQMIVPGTLYRQPIRQILSVNWKADQTVPPGHLDTEEAVTDVELARLYFAHQALGEMYKYRPWLVSVTEKQIEENGKLVNDVDTPIKSDAKIQEQMQLSELDQEEVGEVVAIVRRPNFWNFKGSNSLNLTQNYATDNWFQGKANHYNVQAIVNVEANLNNQRKVQWDNRLELQLGFQTISDNEFQKVKPTNNLMRLNSKLGIKAAKNWNYALSVKAETQLVPNYNYDKNGKSNCITDFLSPLNMDIGLGIDWRWNLKRFSGSLTLSPLTYNFKYVDRIDLATRYGLDKDTHTKSTFGPSATARFNWKIASNISWDSRLYWISNLTYTNIEFENTITFSINKYLTSKFYFYPRFNDQSKNNRMPDADGKRTGTYWMFKEWLSLGVSYNW